MSQPTVTAPCPNIVADTICRTAELGLSIDNAADAGEVTHLFCHPTVTDAECPSCHEVGTLRDHVERRLTDLPIVGHPCVLHVTVPRYTCDTAGCQGSIYRAGLPRAAGRKQSVTRRVIRWILQRMAIDNMSVKACARALGIGWDKTNDLALEACRHLAYGDPNRLKHVQVLGVDEHKWKHVRGDGSASFVTVICDLTAVVDGTGSARLLDMVPGRSADALGDWLKDRDQDFRDTVKVTTMDGFTGYATAAEKHLTNARTVMDPFHVVHLAAGKLDDCRRRVQNDTLGHRGRKGDPLYGIRRTMLTRISLVTPKRGERLDEVLTAEDHVAVQVTWLYYQELIAAYGEDNPRDGKKRMFKVIKALEKEVPDELKELRGLGRTLWKRRKDILAFFDTRASNGPVEALNGRLEHLRGIALGFKNKSHYILRSLIHSGGFGEVINAL